MTSRISEIAKAAILASENRRVCQKMVSKAASLSIKIALAGSVVLSHEKNARPMIQKREIR
jgi:hypothetical protein